MRILVGRVFGIGNSVLSVPMVKALASMGHDVDVLVGDGPDDFGANEVFRELRRFEASPEIGHVWTGGVPFNTAIHDLAIMSIPYDGRWRNGLDFFAKEIMDGRPRPGDPSVLGFDSWEKHEAEYQMDNARSLGFAGETPDSSFMERGSAVDPDLVYLGIGYKRDPGGFGLSKHFGNFSFAELMREITRLRPSTRFLSSGPILDMTEVAQKISWMLLRSEVKYRHRLTTGAGRGLVDSFDAVRGCAAYIGNDTGMMHVAASLDMPTVGLMAYPGLLVKNPPLCKRSRAILFGEDRSSVADIAQQFVDTVWG